VTGLRIVQLVVPDMEDAVSAVFLVPAPPSSLLFERRLWPYRHFPERLSFIRGAFERRPPLFYPTEISNFPPESMVLGWTYVRILSILPLHYFPGSDSDRETCFFGLARMRADRAERKFRHHVPEGYVLL